MKQKKRGLWLRKGGGWAILAIVGFALAIFGVLWLTVIFPWLEKIPADYERSYYFQGEFQVANPTTRTLDPIPVTITREHKANGTIGNILLIKEDILVINSDTNEVFNYSVGELAVDRSSRANVPEYGDMGREGYWSPPPRLGAGDSFYMWTPGADRPLEAKYAGIQEFRGLEVLVFKVEESDLSLGPDPQAGSMELYLSTMITLKIEPNSGTVVDEKSFTLRSYDVPGTGKVPAFIADVRFAEDTIVDLMDIARSARWKLLWFRTLVPWIAIAVGSALVVGATFIARRYVPVPVVVSEPVGQTGVGA